MTAQTNHSLPTSHERDSSATRVAAELAASLRAMRRAARSHWQANGAPCYSITMDLTRISDLSDAADVIERQAAEILALKEAAHGLSMLAGELAADLDKANSGADDPYLSARFEGVL